MATLLRLQPPAGAACRAGDPAAALAARYTFNQTRRRRAVTQAAASAAPPRAAPAPAEMDGLDREILNEIQWSFPLEARPYDALASRFGTGPEDVKSRISRLKRAGVLRQLSAIFDTRRLGYKSSLVAMQVEPGRLERVAELVNAHPGVSHNYERRHAFNLWFTLAVPPGADLKSEVGRLGRIRGVARTRMLPTIRLFKIGVRLEMVESKKRDVAPSEPERRIERAEFAPSESDREFVRQLQKDLPVEDRPFLPAARSLGMSEGEVFERLRRYEEIGVMRRYAAILRHRDAGFTANGMIVWRVPDGMIEDVGSRLGAFPQVSHCYQRPVYPDWKYNVFSMIHCKSEDEARRTAASIRDQVGVDEYEILFSAREFKKTRVEYFVEGSFEIDESELAPDPAPAPAAAAG